MSLLELFLIHNSAIFVTSQKNVGDVTKGHTHVEAATIESHTELN